MTEPPESPPVQPAPVARYRWLGKLLGITALAALLIAVLALVAWTAMDEMKTSRRQAARLAAWARGSSFKVEPGRSDAIRFAGAGPFDQRLGYHELPAFIERLQAQDFQVSAQARLSPELLDVIDRGMFATYPEKNQAGLTLLDCRGQTLLAQRFPQRQYGRFDAIPPLLVSALLFIEDRQLLDPEQPMRNPALDWSRLARAVSDQALHWIDRSHPAPGGSTLATQLEKYRHSPGGRTDSMAEKWRQMVSGSLRAYLDGEENLPRRRQIVVDYLDTVPLAARAGFGEVNGVGDGLFAWYGRDFAEASAALAGGDTAEALQRQALAFKQLLSLLVSQRRPSYYLGSSEGTAALAKLTDSHLRVMAEAGLIPVALRDAALPLVLARAGRPEPAPQADFNQRKAVNALRRHLSVLLDTDDAYALDRLDLSAASTLDGELQRASAAALRGLSDRDGAKAAGLFGPFLLREGDDPSRLLFSFTLFERGEQGNRLRVQTDSLNQPFDINDGARLDLGSTAKLRTLVTYLELVAELHDRWQGLEAKQLAALPVDERDVLGRWARQHLVAATDRGLPAMLSAAMDRQYSANPGEGFFTGGGLHYFENFEAADNHRVVTVREALTRSVNLVFIRLMRDVVRHLMFDADGNADALRAEPDDPARRALLARFADSEGGEFLQRFWRQFRGQSPVEVELRLLKGRSPTVPRLASVFGELEPKADARAMADFIRRHLPERDGDAAALSGDALPALYKRYGGGAMSLADRGYVAGVHPLALWLAGWLRHHPQGTWQQALAASSAQRQVVYGWLFKTRHRSAQDSRIRSLLEVDVFAEIQRRWQRLGYPFEALTPSYATSIGASGDRPSALAELMGIIVNGGMQLPAVRIDNLEFAGGTPYETRLSHQSPEPERVMAPEVAATVRTALLTVVESGTAKRLKGAFAQADGKPIDIGGKTGTGDHHVDARDRSGRVLSSRVVSRSATLVFLIGDRWFGTVMAYVEEPYAARYKFTSALPAQLLKSLAPTLQPLLQGEGCR